VINGILRSRFSKVRPIGQGRVFFAQDDLHDGKSVTIKSHLLPSQLAAERSTLFRSLDTYLSLRHPGLGHPLDIISDYDDPRRIYSIVEFVPGEPFFPAIRTVSTASFLDIVAQFCGVLQYLHSHNYFHLDLHPNNVLLVPPNDDAGHWRLKLIDLPVLSASLLLGAKDHISFNRTFSAPEIIKGLDFDGRADLYSLGTLIHLALLGEPPNNAIERPDDTIDLSTITPEFLVPIVKKLIRREPEQRYGCVHFIL
jgi:eukaryotic-like serine/threonine-protein kinase